MVKRLIIVAALLLPALLLGLAGPGVVLAAGAQGPQCGAWSDPVPPTSFPTSVKLVSLASSSPPAWPVTEIGLMIIVAVLALTFIAALGLRLARPRVYG